MFYLKYRPQKIVELDLVSVRERLTNVLGKKKVPHAYLFSGPRGTGKTSAARIVAKLVNCLERTDRGNIEPCNNCNSCVSIKEGRHLDIIEIDGASNRGIDQIRDLRDKIALSPSSALYKVYIIDEVHMLTNEAFNALLKTLEEPPAHAIFILATTEPHKLPLTVKSRCVEVSFSKAMEEEVVRSLKRVIEGEGLRVEDDVLGFIARVCDGSFRDATKILEEASGFGKQIELEVVEKIFGGGGRDVGEFLRQLQKRNVDELLSFINKKVEDGVDVSWLTRATLNSLHAQFLEGYGVERSAGSRLKAQGSRENKNNKFNAEELIRLMRLLEIAAQEERTAVIVQMPLELAVIEWCIGGEGK